MSAAQIRLVQEKDIPSILEIYRPYVLETAISFEYEVPSIEDFNRRVRIIACDYPYLVYLLDEKIIGYAYAHKQMERAAYQWNAELSVYVDQSYVRRGIGKALYGCLLEILSIQHVQNVYGIVRTPNPNSEKLHESFGFRKLGVFHQTGYKSGCWHDVTWFEKSIGTHDPCPQPFLSIQRIDPQAILEIMDRYSHAHAKNG